MGTKITEKVEYKTVNDTDLNILSVLDDIIETYKKENNRIAIGIAEDNPETVLEKFSAWDKLTVVFRIKTLYMLNIIEFWMIDEHWKIYADKAVTEEFDLTFEKEKYLYILSV